MVTQTRTPRRRKIWAGYHNEVAATSTLPDIHDLLEPTLTSLGVADLPGITVMRVVGKLTLVSGTAGATTPAHVQLGVGLAWIDQNVAATSGSALPLPEQHGVRETRWYQQWVLGGLEYAAPVVYQSPLLPIEHSTTGYIDLSNQQRQPGASTAKFCLVVATRSGTVEADTMMLQVDLDIMLALP